MTTADRSRILVVDDEPQVRRVITSALDAEGITCDGAADPREARALLGQARYDLILSDVRMPGESVMDLLAETRETYGSETPTLLIAAVDDRDAAVRAMKRGAYGYVIKPFKPEEIVLSVHNALERRRLALESRDHARDLEDEVRRLTGEARAREEELVLRLMSASEYRDDRTGAHVRRIGLYCAELAERLGWDRAQVDHIRLAAAMHDIGKIGVPDRVLLKPGTLSSEEFEVIKGHTRIGARILAGSGAPLIEMARQIALSHHERWDGTGYPEGRAGEAIPASARLAAVADVYDALVSHRVYRPALTEREAIGIIGAQKGRQFAPQVLDCFFSALPALHRLRDVAGQMGSP